MLGSGPAQHAEGLWSLGRRQAVEWVGKSHIDRRQQGRAFTSESAGNPASWLIINVHPEQKS